MKTYVIVRSSLTYQKSVTGHPLSLLWYWVLFASAAPKQNKDKIIKKKLPNKHISYTVPSTRVRRESKRRFLDVVHPFNSHELPHKMNAPEVEYHFHLFL